MFDQRIMYRVYSQPSWIDDGRMLCYDETDIDKVRHCASVAITRIIKNNRGDPGRVEISAIKWDGYEVRSILYAVSPKKMKDLDGKNWQQLAQDWLTWATRILSEPPTHENLTGVLSPVIPNQSTSEANQCKQQV